LLVLGAVVDVVALWGVVSLS